jgi:acetoin utilization protein AcuC
MKPLRLEKTYQLIKTYDLLNLPGVSVVTAREAADSEVLSFHSKDYIDTLKTADCGIDPADGWKFGLGFGDNPVFEGIYRWSLLSTGASVQAAEIVGKGEAETAFNISGGLHHAMKGRASGFCYINDPAVAINTLTDLGKRVAYIDIDAHHGDGVQAAFYDRDNVLTISIHERGDSLFPGTGWTNETGSGKGQGFSLNLPMPPESDDALYLMAFKELVPHAMGRFKPDIIVTQLGVDTLRSDPITHLNLTIQGFARLVEEIKALSIPWVALGGGGYDVGKVAKAWTLAWGIMVGQEIQKGDDDFLDTPFALPQHTKNHLWEGIRNDIAFLKTVIS